MSVLLFVTKARVAVSTLVVPPSLVLDSTQVGAKQLLSVVANDLTCVQPQSPSKMKLPGYNCRINLHFDIVSKRNHPFPST